MLKMWENNSCFFYLLELVSENVQISQFPNLQLPVCGASASCKYHPVV